MIFIAATECFFAPTCTVLLSIEEYIEYLDFQGPIYERYRQHSFGGSFLHFTDEAVREQWLVACNRFNEADDELNYRDMWGERHCSLQRRDELEAIMQEAVKEMDACAVYEKCLDFWSCPKPPLTIHQLQSLVDELLTRYQRYSQFLKNWDNTGERADFGLVEPVLAEKFRFNPKIWRNPSQRLIWEFLSYDLGTWLWTSLRDYPHVFWGKLEEEVLPQFYEKLKLDGFELIEGVS